MRRHKRTKHKPEHQPDQLALARALGCRATLRAFGMASHYYDEGLKKIDVNSKIFMLVKILVRWDSSRINVVAALFGLCLTTTAVALRARADAGRRLARRGARLLTRGARQRGRCERVQDHRCSAQDHRWEHLFLVDELEGQHGRVRELRDANQFAGSPRAAPADAAADADPDVVEDDDE